jgi:hypothetical protein
MTLCNAVRRPIIARLIISQCGLYYSKNGVLKPLPVGEARIPKKRGRKPKIKPADQTLLDLAPHPDDRLPSKKKVRPFEPGAIVNSIDSYTRQCAARVLCAVRICADGGYW